MGSDELPDIPGFKSADFPLFDIPFIVTLLPAVPRVPEPPVRSTDMPPLGILFAAVLLKALILRNQ